MNLMLDKQWVKEFLSASKVNYDTYGMTLLQPITGKFVMVPLFTSSAIRPIALAALINDVVINRRKTIIEFGAGLTTLYLAKVIKLYKLETNFISVEENADWLHFLKAQLEAEGLTGIVDFVEAPLKNYDHGKWYDQEKVIEKIKAHSIDLAIVDGPTAYQKGESNNRYLALPTIKKYMASEFSLYLDDVNRPGELQILKKWEADFSLEFRILYRSVGYACRGEALNTIPIL